LSTLVTIEKVGKKYRNATQYSLHDISFNIPEGEKFGILGPNGAGKTTLISILCGVLRQSHGKVFYRDNNHLPTTIGFVPQDFAFYEELTAMQNLEYFGVFYDLTRNEIRERSSELLNRLGLKCVMDKKVKTFSGGMKRRLNLAIGIMHKPRLLFLDEPTVGVDIQSKNAIINFLNELNQQGTTIIYTSHHLQEAEDFCNHVVILDNGQVIACDTIGKLKQDHQADSLMQVLLKLTGEDYRDHV
jgi:ABC-2 type transport system ATP-binding protein